MSAATLQLIILPAGVIAILFALYLARDVLRARHRHAGDAGRRRDDLRGRGRLHPPPVHDDRDPRGRRRGRDRRRHRARRDARPSPTPQVYGVDLGWRTGDRLPRRRRLLDGVRDHRHVHRRPVERPDGLGRPAQPRRGGPGRDARRRRLGLPRRRPVAPRRVPASSPPSAAFGRSPRPRRRSSSSASASAPPSSRCSPSSAAASTRRPPTSARTSSARSRRASPRTTRATRPSSRTSSATTSATAPAAARTCSSRPPPRTSAR